MEYYSNAISQLIQQLSRLPGIGQKSAQRLAFHIINMPKEQVQQLATAMTEVLPDSDGSGDLSDLQ